MKYEQQSNPWFRAFALAVALIVGHATSALAARPAPDDTQFLEFPVAVRVVAATSGNGFAWLVRQGEQTKVMFAQGPAFAPVTLDTRTDRDGQPVSDIAISPDGRFVAFVTGETFVEGQAHNPAGLINPPSPTLWVVSTQKGASARRVGNGTGPLFAVGGSRLLYRQGQDLRAVEVAADIANDQVLLPGGAAFAEISQSADGGALAFVHDRGGYAFLGVYRRGEDRVNWLVTGPDRVASPVWSPDGTRLAYVQRPGREHDKTYDFTQGEPLSIHVVDARTGDIRTVWQASGSAALAYFEDPDSALRWAGDDRLVFYSEHDGWARLYTVPVAGGSPSAITPAGCEVAESEQISPTELFVVHNCVDRHLRQASIIDVRTAKQTPVTTNDVVLANAAAGANGLVAFVGGDANAAPLLRIVQASSRRTVFSEKPLDHGYRVPGERATPEVVMLRAEDGVEASAQLFLPTGRGPHPALIYVHGGPKRQMFPAYHFSEYYARCYAFNRRLAQLGYVVLAVNFRSGVGYGRAFREAEERGWRGASEYRDVLAAARWLGARGDVDRKRIGIWGGSYGGLLTAQALARNSDLFAAGVSVHGVYDWSWPSTRPGHLNPSHFFGVSEADRKVALASSPLAFVDQWKSPVVLFSGDADMNVDVLETVDLAQKLRARGVSVETVLVAGEPHGFIRHETWLRLWRKTSGFFGEKLRPGFE